MNAQIYLYTLKGTIMKKQLLALVFGAVALQACANENITADQVNPENVINCYNALKMTMPSAEAKAKLVAKINDFRTEDQITIEVAAAVLKALDEHKEEAQVQEEVQQNN